MTEMKKKDTIVIDSTDDDDGDFEEQASSPATGDFDRNGQKSTAQDRKTQPPKSLGHLPLPHVAPQLKTAETKPHRCGRDTKTLDDLKEASKCSEEQDEKVSGIRGLEERPPRIRGERQKQSAIEDTQPRPKDLEEKPLVLPIAAMCTQAQSSRVDPQSSSAAAAKKRMLSQLSTVSTPQPSSSDLSTARPLHTEAPRYVRADWPNHVVNLRAHFNPDRIVLPYMKPFGGCECESVCRYGRCRNSKLGVYCASNNCPFKGVCGNGLVESENLVLAKDLNANALAVIASKTIPKGVVIGQYLGRITLEPPKKNRTRNRGYKMLLHKGPRHAGLWRACIDAEIFGSLMRFVNHSCNAPCAFAEVSNGHSHTVVVVTLRQLNAGDEVTANYGDDLWFICKCGHPTCCHSDIQPLAKPNQP